LREVRLDPANLVLLLSVRVATAAAVECRHELANAARAAEAVEESLRIETRALGGELCLVEDAPSASGDETGPHLGSPCPFFKSPIDLPEIVADAEPRDAAASHVRPGLVARRAASDAPRALYRPRAPPVPAGEVLARAPRSRPVHPA
tara:strand:+ start:2198 stop:2641 length:444 start_codon:yes stop_codon:yes gene_type:complete